MFQDAVIWIYLYRLKIQFPIQLPEVVPGMKLVSVNTSF